MNGYEECLDEIERILKERIARDSKDGISELYLLGLKHSLEIVETCRKYMTKRKDYEQHKE